MTAPFCIGFGLGKPQGFPKHMGNLKTTRETRFFRRGTCFKGIQCKFIHANEIQKKLPVPFCKKVETCSFFRKYRCFFFHPGVGVQNQRHQSKQARECRYRNNCWKINLCPFTHFSKVFRPAHKTYEPPISQTQEMWWMNY